MASVCGSAVLLGFLVLVVMCRNIHSSDGEAAMMEEEELVGLFEVLGSLLEDSFYWAQMHPLPCTDTPWPGLECEVSQEYPPIFHVTKIHLGPDILNPPCKSSAKISISLLKLPFLKTLSLFNCFTSPSSPVSLPSSIFGAFSSLECLVLESNPSLSGEIPPSLSEIPGLRIICLSQNSLIGEIPAEIGGLVSLEQLDLSYNNLSGSIPQKLGGLKSLAILDLSFNGFTGKLPSSLGQLETLQKIDLSSNHLHGRPPQDLGKLKRMVLLDLSHNSLNGPLPETFSGLKKLEYFIIEDNPLYSAVPLFIGALMELRVISFSGCGLVGPIPSSILNLKNLTALSLEHNFINGTIPPDIGSLPNLNFLNLSQNRLSGELGLPDGFVQRLGNRLDIRGNHGLCCTSLQHLDIEIPSCLAKNKTLAEEQQPDHTDSKNMKPTTWDRDDNIISSDNVGFHQNVVFSGFLTVCYTSLLFLVQ